MDPGSSKQQNRREWRETDVQVLHQNKRKCFFTLGVSVHRKRLLREAAKSSSLEIFKNHVNEICTT